ncbi:glutamate receptor ionotropic, kainate 4 isoform X2 [Dermatophagoides farinae]|uniref:glutamate receptor ionotropic, kainate 4 isoform X2 n=2 Tax=Dermatophagoides farinae TaxID=6954 RepID=UPI003F6148B2
MKLNLMGKIFRIGINYYSPFTAIDLNQTLSASRSSSTTNGIEIEMLNTMANYFNFSYKLINYNGIYGDPIDHNYINGTWTGIVAGLIANKIDLGIGGITHKYERQKVIKFLYPHWIDRLTYATTMPEHEQLYLDRFFHPFHSFVWIMLIIVFISFTIFNWLDCYLWIDKKRKNSFVWSMMGTLLRQPLSSSSWITNEQRQSKKCLFIIWLLSTIILTSAYSGCLLSNIAIPESKYIDNIWKLIDSLQTEQLLMIGTDNELNYLKEFMEKRLIGNHQHGKHYNLTVMIKNHRESLRILMDESTKFSHHHYYQYNGKSRRRQLAILLSEERANLIRISLGDGSFYLPPNNPSTTLNQNIMSFAINSRLYDQYHNDFNQLIQRIIATGMQKC